LKKLVVETTSYKIPENLKDSSLQEAIKLLTDLKKEIGIERNSENV